MGIGDLFQHRTDRRALKHHIALFAPGGELSENRAAAFALRDQQLQVFRARIVRWRGAQHFLGDEVNGGERRAEFMRGRSGEPAGAPAAPSASREKRDSMTITIAPFQRTEVKLEMTKGQKASYRWKADAADVTFNLHGEGPDAPGGRAYSYARGSSRAETGEIVALFDGDHGWSWRNTSDKPVKIVVTAWGQFQKLKQP